MDTFTFCVVLFLCGYTKAMSIGGQTYISKREDEYVQRIFYDRERQEKQKLQETLLQYVKEKYVPMRNQNGKYFNIRHYDYLLETLFNEKDARQKLQNVVNTLQMKMENLTSRTMLQSDIVFKDLEKIQASIKQLQKKNSDLESKVSRFQSENKNMERNLTFFSNENNEMRKANKALNRDVDKLKGLKNFKDIHEQEQRNFSDSLELIFGQVENQTSDILTLKQRVKGLSLQNSISVIKITTIDKKYTNLSQDVYKVKFEREAMQNEVNVLRELDVKNALKRTDAEVKEIRAKDAEITQDLDALRNVTLMIKSELDTVKYRMRGIGRKFKEPCRTDSDCIERMMCSNDQCICHNSYWNGTFCFLGKAPEECSDLNITQSGIYTIYDAENKRFDVYCLVEKRTKWTVFQRRLDGTVDFNKNWKDYRNGFGNLSGEFWLGNELLHSIAATGSHKLRVNLIQKGERDFFAEYSTFTVTSESDKYRLHVTGYSGNAGNSLSKSADPLKASGMKFSTNDNDNDRYIGNCASDFQAGWWYKACYSSNLNIHLGRWYYDLGSHNIVTSMMMITRN